MVKAQQQPPDLSKPNGRLRWAREHAGFRSIRAAARHFGWNENTYKSHEQGIRQAEGLKEVHARRYARAFKVSTSWLMVGEGHPRRNDSRVAPGYDLYGSELKAEPAQLRAARALLGLSQAELASRAGISIPTVKRVETDVKGAPRVAETTRDRIRSVLETAGIEFTNGEAPGVRLHRRAE